MTLKLTEVAKARRRLAIEHKRSKDTLGKVPPEQNTNARPVFVSVRSMTAA